MKILINARRNGYSTDQCKGTLTVGELISLLKEFNRDAEVFLSHDNGYTFGEIKEYDFECVDEDDDEENDNEDYEEEEDEE